MERNRPRAGWVDFLRVVAAILLALTLAGYAGCSSYDLLGAPSGISLKPDKWSILHSYSMPTKPSAEGNGWAFDFPKGSNCKVKEGCPGVHYVTTPYTKNIAYGAKLAIEGEIVADPGVSFNYQPEKSNTCTTPATARAFIQKHNDDLYAANGRFWANPVASPMAPGKFSVTVPFDIDNWSNVVGERNGSGFKQLLGKMGNIGLTFGGGCFFGHGINVSGGNAKFIVTGFAIR